MFGYDLGIDLGTTNIVIGVPGKGIRLDEPAYVAYDEEKEKVLYVWSGPFSPAWWVTMSWPSR